MRANEPNLLAFRHRVDRSLPLGKATRTPKGHDRVTLFWRVTRESIPEEGGAAAQRHARGITSTPRASPPPPIRALLLPHHANIPLTFFPALLLPFQPLP